MSNDASICSDVDDADRRGAVASSGATVSSSRKPSSCRAASSAPRHASSTSEMAAWRWRLRERPPRLSAAPVHFCGVGTVLLTLARGRRPLQVRRRSVRARLFGVAVLDDGDGLPQAADPALDRGDQVAGEGRLARGDRQLQVVVDVEDGRGGRLDFAEQLGVLQELRAAEHRRPPQSAAHLGHVGVPKRGCPAGFSCWSSRRTSRDRRARHPRE